MHGPSGLQCLGAKEGPALHTHHSRQTHHSKQSFTTGKHMPFTEYSFVPRASGSELVTHQSPERSRSIQLSHSGTDPAEPSNPPVLWLSMAQRAIGTHQAPPRHSRALLAQPGELLLVSISR